MPRSGHGGGELEVRGVAGQDDDVSPEPAVVATDSGLVRMGGPARLGQAFGLGRRWRLGRQGIGFCGALAARFGGPAEAAEGPDGGLGAVVALGGLLARQARHHGVVTLVQLWMVPARRQAAGGQAAGQHLEEQHADREQVALHGGPKAAPLLWRHVGDRADSSGRDRGLSFA